VSNMYNVASSPHVRAKDNTQRIMLYVIISLLPASVFGIFNFGYRALILIVLTIAAAVVSEWIFDKITHRKNTVGDLSAVVTGLLLALNFPSTLPWWIALFGGAFAIIVVKCLFGGLGQNFMNPALGARCFLLLSFTSQMSNFQTDTYTGATPLALIRSGESVNTLDMFLGKTAGTIGETSVICLLIGAAFLIAMGVIDLRIPASYIIAFVVFIVLFGGHLTTGDFGTFVVSELCGGGLMLGAFFMATDYVTSPITPKGKIIYGIIAGILLGIFRMFGSMAEGCSYSIIFANLLVPLIERWTIPKPFGKGGEK
jgi:electron transport complex protein RnfD